MMVVVRRQPLQVVDDGGGEKTTIAGCLMMPNQASANAETRFGCGQYTFTY